jgi:hypothetical protein
MDEQNHNKHLQQTLQSNHFVKFNNFCSIFFLQQGLYFESPFKICYSELSYMKVTVAPFIIILYFFLSPIRSLSCSLNAFCFPLPFSLPRRFLHHRFLITQNFFPSSLFPNRDFRSISHIIRINTPMLFNSGNMCKILLPKPKS